uniref:Uncharacterized protein n=1 Tax=Zea mays TaxID=4577 RepID=C4J4F4_MAIZE|nr:unknown [Zea mays]
MSFLQSRMTRTTSWFMSRRQPVTSRSESSDIDRTSTPTASVEMARLVRRCSVVSNVRSSGSDRHAAS